MFLDLYEVNESYMLMPRDAEIKEKLLICF